MAVVPLYKRKGSRGGCPVFKKGKVITMNKEMYTLVMKNAKEVGNKKFVVFPVALLYADPRFQRIDDATSSRITKLADNWDTNKMDPLRVSFHDEECMGSVIDGYHRLCAAKRIGLSEIECEVLQGLSDFPATRLKEEARLFADQDDQVSRLTPQQKHLANCLCGVKENVELQRIIDKFEVKVKPDRARRASTGYLQGFTAALNVCKTNPKILEKTFTIIQKAKWDMATNGYSALVINSISAILTIHRYNDDITKYLIKYFRPIEPAKFFADAMVKYPERREKERLVLMLEDHLVDTYQVKRLYTGGKVVA